MDNNNMADKYKHINGWGIDADPENDPTYPMKKYNGADHQRLNYQRPPQQPEEVEVLLSNERPNLSATFGTSSPPAGLSGAIRRYAFKYDENSFGHWLPLMLADRVNILECFIDEIIHGHFPNFFAENGFKAEWKYNRPKVVKKIAKMVIVTSAIIALLTVKNKKRKASLFKN